MEIFRFSLGSLQANCYLLVKNEKCLIIDPADDASFILTEIQRKKLDLVALFATHGHFDHIMAVGEIQLSYPAPFYISKDDLFLVKRIHQTAKYFLGYEPYFLPPKHIEYFPSTLSLGWNMKIISTPGHTPGSVCFYFPPTRKATEGKVERGLLFTGDTLFKDGVGSHDHSYSSKKDLYSSISKILRIPGETIIFPGHGEETTISQEKKRYIKPQGKLRS